MTTGKLSGILTAGKSDGAATWSHKGSRSGARLGSDFALGPGNVIAVSSPRSTAADKEWCGAVDIFAIGHEDASAVE